MNYIEDLLPIGSVVLFENASKPVLIVGYYSRINEKGNEIYDYSCVYYPEGLLSSDEILFFNHNKIKEIIFLGYKDEESNNFIDELKKYVKKENNKSQI